MSIGQKRIVVVDSPERGGEYNLPSRPYLSALRGIPHSSFSTAFALGNFGRQHGKENIGLLMVDGRVGHDEEFPDEGDFTQVLGVLDVLGANHTDSDLIIPVTPFSNDPAENLRILEYLVANDYPSFLPEDSSVFELGKEAIAGWVATTLRELPKE